MIRNEGSSSILFSKWEKFLPKKKREKKWWKGEKKILKDNETKSERKISNQRLEQKDQETIGKWYLRYSTRRAIHMAALQTRKLVGLTVGLPVSVRCILTLFARHFLAMCPCSVCVPTFYSPLPSPLPSSCVYAYIYTSSQESVNLLPLFDTQTNFFSLWPIVSFSPRLRFACCFCVVLDAWFISNVSNVFYIPWSPRRPFWYPTRIVWISLAFLPLKTLCSVFWVEEENDGQTRRRRISFPVV